MEENKKYEIIDAYGDGFELVRKTYAELQYKYTKKHNEILHQFVQSLKKDMENTLIEQGSDMDKLLETQDYLLVMSRMGCILSHTSNPTKMYDSVEQAELGGIMEALLLIRTTLDDANEVATDEQKDIMSFMERLYQEIEDILFQNNYTRFKNKNHPGWYLANEEQKERYFDEYLAMIKQPTLKELLEKRKKELIIIKDMDDNPYLWKFNNDKKFNEKI